MITYIKEHFANTKNTDIAAHCGISLTTLHRIARENGLRKDPIKNKRTYNLRYYLRKKGYIVDRYKVSLNETTKRSEYCEKKAKYLGFKLNFL